LCRRNNQPRPEAGVLGRPPRGGRSRGEAPVGGEEDCRPFSHGSAAVSGRSPQTFPPAGVQAAGSAASSGDRWLGGSRSRPEGRARRPAGSLEALRVTRPEAVACASVSVQGQGGASPPQVDALRPVTDGNRVAARRGGKQPEVNGQSATKVNSIRPSRVASLQAKGEAQTGASRMPPTLRGSVSKRWEGRGGGWRRNGRTALHRTQRDLRGPDGARARHAGVRGAIVARKPGNAGGAKGSRKMDAT
jgi:hypothetical protein